MNQYDQYIRDFLFQHKSVSFEKIGRLYVSDQKPGSELPVGGLTFEYDKKAVTTPGLITYAAEKSGKNINLVHTDIESYFELMRQILNIGNPHEIEGLGVFKTSREGVYEFKIPEYSPKKEEHKAARNKQAGLGSNAFSPGGKKNKSALMLLAMAIVLVVLGVLGWGAYELIKTQGQKDVTVTDTAETYPLVMPQDTSAQVKTDSAALQQAVIPAGDSAEFKFIHETTRAYARATTRTNKLIGYNNPAGFDSLITDTGKVYRLYIKMKIKPSDSTRIKDSLGKHLQRPINIEPFR